MTRRDRFDDWDESRRDPPRQLRSGPGPLDKLAAEIKAFIARSVPIRDAVALSCVDSEWRKVTEDILWEKVGVLYLECDVYDIPLVDHTRPGSYRAQAEYGILYRWRKFEKDVVAQPGRAERITSLHMEATQGCAAIIMRVLPQLKNLQVIVQTDHDDGTSADLGMMVVVLQAHLEAVGRASQIRHLEFELGDDRGTHAEIGALLARLPQLSRLRLVGPESAPVLFAEEESSHNALPALTYLELRSDYWGEDAVNIARAAPKLAELRVGGAWRTSEVVQNISTFCKVKVLHVAVLEKGASADLIRYITDTDKAWLEGLESLSVKLDMDGSADSAASSLTLDHPTLESLCVVLDDVAKFGHYCATRPSSQVTGYLSPWLVGLLLRCPSLTHFVVLDALKRILIVDGWITSHPVSGDESEPESDDSEDEDDDYDAFGHRRTPRTYSDSYRIANWRTHTQGFFIRTFTRDSDHDSPVLYHARCRNVPPTSLLLCPHVYTYEPQAEQDLSRTLRTRMSHLNCDGEGHKDMDKGSRRGEWLDVTFFDGYPIPTALLEWVYTFVDDSLQMSNSECYRDASLPDHVWEVLDAWRAEVSLVDLTIIRLAEGFSQKTADEFLASDLRHFALACYASARALILPCRDREVWLPRLESLQVMDEQYSMHRSLPGHPTLRTLRVGHPPDLVTNRPFGQIEAEITNPSELTGLLRGWVVSIMDRCPNLNLLAIKPWSLVRPDPDEVAPAVTDTRNGLVIRSFTDGPRSLYHARCRRADVAVQEQSSGPAPRANASNDSPIVSEAASSDATADELGGGHDGQEVPDYWVDLTWYKGRAISPSMLDRVGETIPGGKDWTEGSRGLLLPPDVWASLNG